MLEKAGVLALIGALALPYTTMLRWHYPNINESMRAVPLFIFTALALAFVGMWIYLYNRPLGIFCSYCALSTLFTQTSLSLATAHWIVLGSGLYVILCKFFKYSFYRKIAIFALIISGIIQSLVVLLQFFRVSFVMYTQQDFMHGTLTHHNFLGVFLALIIPLAPFVVLPILFLGLLISTSLTGFIAAFIGLIVNIKNYKLRIYTASLGICIVVFTFWGKSHDSLYSRLRLWLGAFSDFDSSWFTLLFGKGLGSWYISYFVDIKDPEQVFYQAHNEYLQLLYETGILGLALLIWFLYENRRFFTNGATLSLIVCCSTIYVFHVVFLAVTAIVIMAIIASKKEDLHCPKCEESLAAESSSRLQSAAYYV